jgi:hypothetical protein
MLAGGQVAPIAAFIPAAHPGALPAGNAAAGIISNYKLALDEFRLQTKNLNVFKAQLIQSLSETTQDSIFDPITGAMNMSCLQILTALDAEYGMYKPSDLEDLLNLLKVPYNPSEPLHKFVSNLRMIHAQLAESNNPENEHAKVKSFATALRPCGIYDNFLGIWFVGHAAILAQTFDQLTTDALDWDASQPKAPMAVTSEEDVPFFATKAALDQYVRSEFAKKAATVTLPAANAANGGGKAPRPWNLYCWTHGVGGHLGSACRSPAAGHQSTATGKNRMGGK